MIVSCSPSQESELQHLGAVVRQERSLLNTFPFTEAQEIQSSARFDQRLADIMDTFYTFSIPREVKQSDDVRTDFDTVAASPERCIEKVLNNSLRTND